MAENSKRVAILVTDGFEEVELCEPREALQDAGMETVIVAPHDGKVTSWQKTDWGSKFEVDATLAETDGADYDALLLPGGVINPDALRIKDKAVAFVQSFVEAEKPVAAICHGPWTLIEAGAAKGRKMTSWPSLKNDLANAGAEWVDQEVVVDGNFVTSRNPGDLPAFCRETVRLFQAA
ncbi:MAG: protease [Rhizobiales bacterium NRL2]|jgi:protease I|nr:MAG: protease [Rhizobiales bacterium NRL2]